VVDEIGLRAEDYALVNVTYCKGDKLYVSEVDRGRVNVAAHNMQTTESTADYIFSGEEFLSMTDDVLGKPKTSEVKRVARSITDDFRFDFLWGFHNWGSTPFNGLMRMDGGYALQTTFSSYQLEAVYYPMVSDNWRLGLGLGYGSDVYKFSDDYVAVVKPGGLGMPLHEVCKGFNPVYGSHHKFYGAMDFFYLSTYVNGFTPGLQNAYIGAFYEPIKQLSLKVNYHYLATGTKLNGLNSTLGHEIEVEAAYVPARDIRIAAGYSYMTGTETMEKLKRATGDGNLRWAWLSLNVMPRLFSAKW
jgi:hypothetical protein